MPDACHLRLGNGLGGLKNAQDLAAPWPRSISTLKQHLTDTQRTLEDYDLILTGDLGKQGSKMLKILLQKENFAGLDRLEDGGAQIYGSDLKTGAGGSGGAACVAVMTLGYLLNKLNAGRVKRVLVIATGGALLSALSVGQGETIPCIAHAVALER